MMPSFAIPVIALGLAPFAIYLALKRPIIFPLGLYVMMVPFDVILGTSTTLTRVVAVATAGTLLFHMIVTRRVVAPPKSWTAWAVLILWASLTALWTVDMNGSMLVLGQVLQLFLFFTILAIYPVERQELRLLGAIIVASGTLVSSIGLFLYMEGNRTQENRLSITANGISIDPNHYAAALLLPIALALGTLLETRNVRLRFAAGVATLIMVTALFLTGSRGGFISLSVMLLYLAWKTRYRLQILGFMAAAGMASLLLPTVWERFSDPGLGGGSGRLFIWNAGKLALKDHWIIGAGVGGFPAAYNHELLAMYQPVFQGWSRPAHNAILSAAVEFGIFGAAMLIYAWWRSWSDARGNVVIEASIIGIAVASQFLDVLFFKYIWLVFAMAAMVKNAAEPRFLRGTSRPAPAIRRMHIVSSALAWRNRRNALVRRNRETVTNHSS